VPDFDPISSILSSGQLNVDALLANLVYLAPKYKESKHTTAQSIAGTTLGTSYGTIPGASVAITAEDDELIVCYTKLNLSQSVTTGSEWQFRHNFSGATLSVSDRSKYRASASATTGKSDERAFMTFFAGYSGSLTIVAEWGNGDAEPAGTIYTHVGHTVVLQFKVRAG
jgi:hypothetical protein